MQFEGLDLGRSRGGQENAAHGRTPRENLGLGRARGGQGKRGARWKSLPNRTLCLFFFVVFQFLFFCVWITDSLGHKLLETDPFFFCVWVTDSYRFVFFVRSRRPGGERQKRCEGTLRRKKATTAEEVRLRLEVGGEKQNTELAVMKTKSGRQFNPDTY
jgi:hypothetical protein